MTMLRKFAHGFTLVELMVVVAIIGLLSSVAIPSFSRYIRRSRTVEATMNLRRLFDSASAYYMSEKADATGRILPRQFPTTIPWSPDLSACCGWPSNKCAPGGKDNYGLTYNQFFSATTSSAGGYTAWSDPRWQALNFGVEDPHYFQYEALAANNIKIDPLYKGGAGYNGATVGDIYNVEAAGDLNCDFTGQAYDPANPANNGMSLFRRSITVGSAYNLTGGAGIYAVRDIE